MSQDPWSKAPHGYGEQPTPDPYGYGEQPPPYGYGEQPGPYPPAYGYGPPQAYPAPPTNTLAILALVMAFVFAPAAIVLGVVARKQIRETGEQGDGLALAGLILGIAFTALVVIMIVLWIALFAAAVGAVSSIPLS